MVGSSIRNYQNSTAASQKSDSREGNKISKITIHSAFAVLNSERDFCYQLTSEEDYSFHYAIANNGRIGQFVDERNRAWGTGNIENDRQAITILLSNSENKAPWRVSEKCIKSLLALCEDICRRNNIPRMQFTGNVTGNVTLHKWFNMSTDCPGDFVSNLIPAICRAVNTNLNKASKVQYDYEKLAEAAYRTTASYNLAEQGTPTLVSLDQIDPSFLKPYVIQLNRDTPYSNLRRMKAKGVSGVIVELGRLKDDNGHSTGSNYINPNLNNQVSAAVSSGLEYGLIIISSAKTLQEAKIELASFRETAHRYKPTLGLWIDRSVNCYRSVNNDILLYCQKALVEWGLRNKIGIKVPNTNLNFDWPQFSSSWALWVNKSARLEELSQILYPSFFSLR